MRSGGQTGVDRAALDVAIAKAIPYLGWCPKGGWAEDFPHPPGLLDKYPTLVETPAAATEQRTAWNVRDSNATLVLVMGRDRVSVGTDFTRLCAEIIFVRPWCSVGLNESEALEQARRWLRGVRPGRQAEDLVLNIAGPRESEAPGIYRAAYNLLWALL